MLNGTGQTRSPLGLLICKMWIESGLPASQKCSNESAWDPGIWICEVTQAPRGASHANPKAPTASSPLHTWLPSAHTPELIETVRHPNLNLGVLIPQLQKDEKGRHAITFTSLLSDSFSYSFPGANYRRPQREGEGRCQLATLPSWLPPFPYCKAVFLPETTKRIWLGPWGNTAAVLGRSLCILGRVPQSKGNYY